MVLEVAHSKILEYLHKYGQVNTFRLSRHLNIDRIKLINQVEELTNQGLTEFRYGNVKVKEKLEKRNDKVLANINNNLSRVLENQISKIKYFNGNNSLQLINFDRDIAVNILITLYKNFNLTKRDIDGFLDTNRNLGVLLNFIKGNANLSNNWKQFMNTFFPKKKYITKSDYIIISKDYSKLLLVTERKLLSEELKNLNKIIFRINQLIKEHNDKNFAYQTISR